MIKKQFVFITLLFMVVSLSAVSVMAEGSGKQKSSPFLITGKLPHLTKLLMQQWESPELKLSEAQKAKLLVVRKATISGAQKLGKEINALESEVVEGSNSGKKPEELRSIVQKIEKLKGEATMLHLSCIYNTSNILDQQQLAFLTK
ncbi:MAG TPA: hypothetical protein EYG88_06405 [Desulfocapsa sulfexigens]|nr:hypothetical protein [Desulfocapsa sulfexigens]